MSISEWDVHRVAEWRKINPWQQSKAFKAQKIRPHVDSITLPLFKFFFSTEKLVCFVWCDCLSANVLHRAFCHGGTQQIWEEVMLSWGTSTDVTKCQLDEASALSPPSLHCSTQTEEDTKA